MSKPEWGTKRICQSCATKFYDFGRTPITCPKCSAIFDPETLLKSRRSRPAAAAKSSKPVPPTKPDASDKGASDKGASDKDASDKDASDKDDADVLASGDDLPDVPDDDDEDESVIEDTSDLGEDDEEVSKAIVPGKDQKD